MNALPFFSPKGASHQVVGFGVAVGVRHWGASGVVLGDLLGDSGALCLCRAPADAEPKTPPTAWPRLARWHAVWVTKEAVARERVENSYGVGRPLVGVDDRGKCPPQQVGECRE